jgi:hypothetical protein
MKILKPIIGTSFLAGLLGMLLSIVALESGILNGATYWVLVFNCGILSGGAIMAAKASSKNHYDNLQYLLKSRTERNQR